MSTQLIVISILLVYFAVLFVISRITSRKATNDSYFRAGRTAPWYLVAFGMVGTSLSGVTFISVPGSVGTEFFYYFQVVMGYFIGYFIVAFVLLPLYYRLNLTSIYHYLQQRFGMVSYQSGAFLFIISRTLGATLRLYLVINVLQIFVLDELGVDFHITTLLILGMILLYTFKGGVKTIVWTDTLQTFFMLLALVVCVFYILGDLNMSLGDAWSQLGSNGFNKIFNTSWQEKSYFIKHIIGGAVITISMTGLDQEMMQKNISVRTLKDSQKNMITFSAIMVFVNFIFLLLGGLLYLYAMSRGGEFTQVITDGKKATHFILESKNIMGDDLFPSLAMNYLPPVISIIFIIGLISALFPSADGAITALTASFSIDIIGINRNANKTEEERVRTRKKVHLAFAFVFLVMVIFFKWLDNKDIINLLLKIATYTYGPLLGLFAFGILTKRSLQDSMAPIVCLAAPAIAFVLDIFSVQLLNGYKFGNEMLLLNGLLTFAGLWLFSKKGEKEVSTL